ncbi:MAG TPA: hypothetical protein VFB63_22095 [Bryobacteraceae bacterium]|nr:hypothetical protein [Bryobacteraceae bacterium]
MTGELYVEATPWRRKQAEIADVLGENLSVALSMVQTVKAEQETMPGRFRRDLVRMYKALTTIRRLQGRIEDQAKWYEINDLADEVERQWRQL